MIKTVPVKMGGRCYGWLTPVEKSYNNYSIAYFNGSVDISILDVENNICGIIAIPSIESTFDNEHIHVLHYQPKIYIYGYLIPIPAFNFDNDHIHA